MNEHRGVGRDTTAVERLCADITARVRDYLDDVDRESQRIEHNEDSKWRKQHILLSEHDGLRRHALLDVRLVIQGVVWADMTPPSDDYVASAEHSE